MKMLKDITIKDLSVVERVSAMDSHLLILELYPNIVGEFQKITTIPPQVKRSVLAGFLMALEMITIANQTEEERLEFTKNLPNQTIIEQICGRK